MNWLRRNLVGLTGVALALAALALGASAYRHGVRRDEQARGVALRLNRGEPEMAERHREGAAALGELADVLRSLAFYAAAAAVAVGAWGVGSRTSLWPTGATAVLAAGAVALALGSRAEPRAGIDRPPKAGTGR